ncbi:MAG: hypothetical protein OEV46_09895 [Betaproteobacteria bacterium]|nr:hypothetical protein [Betaproteobacteria bacterium]MDH5285146.1 hypothetical protein [Betaproteobacteria bacterium]
MRFRPLLFATVVALSVFAPASRAQPCVGFTDVTVADSFCGSVEWIRNRGVTQGCTAVPLEYCPFGNVTRAQMALFMHRLGKALTPVVLHKQASVANLTVPGPLPGVLMCATDDYAVTDFPRIARFNATFLGTPSSGPSWLQGFWRYSTDAGVTWNYVGNFPVDTFPGRDWADYGQVAGATVLAPPMALSPGSTYRFGLFVNGMGGSYAFHAMICQLEVTIQNANPASSPLDD